MYFATLKNSMGTKYRAKRYPFQESNTKKSETKLEIMKLIFMHSSSYFLAYSCLFLAFDLNKSNGV